MVVELKGLEYGKRLKRLGYILLGTEMKILTFTHLRILNKY